MAQMSGKGFNVSSFYPISLILRSYPLFIMQHRHSLDGGILIDIIKTFEGFYLSKAEWFLDHGRTSSGDLQRPHTTLCNI